MRFMPTMIEILVMFCKMQIWNICYGSHKKGAINQNLRRDCRNNIGADAARVRKYDFTPVLEVT